MSVAVTCARPAILVLLHLDGTKAATSMRSQRPVVQFGFSVTDAVAARV